MSYPINYPTPQNADVQIFARGGSVSDWVKPQGCSFVLFTFIGAGGNGFGGTTSAGGGGGVGGAVSSVLVPAFFIPDVLRISVGQGGVGNTNANRTMAEYQLKAGTAYFLFGAASGDNNGGSGTAPGTGAAASNYFTAIGFLNPTGSQGGAAQGSSISQNALTSGGAGGGSTTTGSGGNITPIYSYPTRSGGAGTTGGNGAEGLSVFSNLIFGTGGAGGGGSTTGAGGNGGNGGVGGGGGGGGICTSGTSQGGKGGDGLAVIVSW